MKANESTMEKGKGENMNLPELVGRIVGSSREDWHLIADAPSYRDHLQFYETYDGQPNVLHVAAHHSVAVYVRDVSITMAWGLKWLEDFKEDWCKNFPDPKAHGGFVDVFFNNALVYRTAYVWVDGIHFPLPRHTKGKELEVDKRACEFMEVIDSMGRAARPAYDKYQSDLRRAGFTVVDKEWPTFML